ncbi:MAG: alkaline phosphatase [Polyangiales bacterium]
MKTKIALGAAILCVASTANAAGEAKNVIFFLGDGMGPAVVTAARIYKYGENGKLHMESLPRTAKIKTFSFDAQTTDSAPSMSAYMTGQKMRNDVIGMTSDTVADPTKCVFDGTNGSKVKNLLEMAKAAGKGVGSVTTTEMTHATPAATYSHICNRNLPYDIAAQAVPGGTGFNADLMDGVDVLFGGGRNHWTALDASANPKGRSDLRNLVDELKGKGWSYAADKTAFDALDMSKSRAVGLFSTTSHMSYELDRDPTLQPSLKEMTLKSIALLKNAAKRTGSDKGYFLMVEGGRIDHALHGTNAKRALEDLIAFDDAIQGALDTVDLKDTLIVVTADHDHTMVINGYAKRGTPILDVVKNLDGTPAKDADGFTYPILAFGNGESRPDTRADMGDTLDKEFHQLSAIKMGAGGETHGGGDVMLMAGGAGSAKFKGTLDNTKIFGLVKEALGL